MAIYFDLEFYVPKSAQQSEFKMKTNPASDDHLLLGGVFYQGDLPTTINRNNFQSLWIWNMPGFDKDNPSRAEQKLIEIINKIFRGELETQDTVKTVGIGTARFDLPALFAKSQQHKIATNETLYRRFLLGFPIDLSMAGVGFVDHAPYGLEPVPANTLYNQFGITTEKAAGSSVWEKYEFEQYKQIEQRTEQEVEHCIRLYSMLAEEIQ